MSATPVLIDVCYHLSPSGGVGGARRLMSSWEDGTRVDLWSEDGGSGRQKWVFTKLSDGTYRIQVGDGINNRRRYLSCAQDGGHVDLWHEDDGSGLQRWRLVPLPSGRFHIHPSGGGPQALFLSCWDDGCRVDLYNKDDGSGRQQWTLASAVPVNRKIQIAAAQTERIHLIVGAPGPVQIRLAWRGTTPLAASLRGAGMAAPLAAVAGRSPLQLGCEVSREGLDQEHRFMVEVTNPSKTSDEVSLEIECLGAEIPIVAPEVRFLSDYPSDREPGWSPNLQGLTHDDEHWYFAQEYAIWKFPVRRDINLGATAADPSQGVLRLDMSQSISQEYQCKALDYYRGHLYVPLELTGKNRVALVDARTMRYLSDVLLPPICQSTPWCAIRPTDGAFFTSEFHDVRRLHVFERRLNQTQIQLTYQHEIELCDRSGAPICIDHVQAGAFSAKTGLLYLSSDKGSRGGIFALWVDDTKRRAYLLYRIPVDYDYTESVFAGHQLYFEELEGLTLWDLSDGRAPHVDGQLHLTMIDNVGQSDDDLYLKHFDVPGERVNAPALTPRPASALIAIPEVIRFFPQGGTQVLHMYNQWPAPVTLLSVKSPDFVRIADSLPQKIPAGGMGTLTLSAQVQSLTADGIPLTLVTDAGPVAVKISGPRMKSITYQPDMGAGAGAVSWQSGDVNGV